MNESVFDLAKASDAIDTALQHLADAERRNIPPAASVASYARLELQRLNERLMSTCEEVSNGNFPP